MGNVFSILILVNVNHVKNMCYSLFIVKLKNTHFMKLLKHYQLMLLAFLFIFSCSKDPIENNIAEQNLDATSSKYNREGDDKFYLDNINAPVYSTNEIIVRYKPDTPMYKIEQLRSEYGIFKDPNRPGAKGEYKVCDLCPDSAIIEKWTFNPALAIDIELVALSIEPEDDEELDSEGNIILGVDQNFEFVLENDSTPNFGTPAYNNYAYNDFLSKIVPNNEGVTIAILDTGLNTLLPQFQNGALPLYNANIPDYPEVKSGWDFVDSDNNTMDEHNLLHGTIVTYVVTSLLNAFNSPYQILPIRISNKHGKTTLFKAVCGVDFAGRYADVANLSFGWYDTGNPNSVINNTIFADLIEEHSNTLFVTSSGNSNNDNDYELKHFPSSYPSDNLLSIAADKKKVGTGQYAVNGTISEFSNYGITTVDFLAHGKNVVFKDMSDTVYYISGTSFAAPTVTVTSSYLLNDSNITPLNIIPELINQYGMDINVNPLKPIKYDKTIAVPLFYNNTNTN